MTKAREHLRVEEIAARRRQCPDPWRLRRWQVIRCAFVNPRPAAEIALEVGLARQTVHHLVAASNRQGPQALEPPGHGQRQRASLRWERERAIVSKFLQTSARGQGSRGVQIQPALEPASGRRMHKTTAYRILKRHQWRKVVPRPRHPQASVEEQAAFKKTSPRK